MRCTPTLVAIDRTKYSPHEITAGTYCDKDTCRWECVGVSRLCISYNDSKQRPDERPLCLVKGSSVLSLDHPVGGGVEPLVALEEGQADDEDVLEGLAALLLDELAGSGGRASGRDEVADVSSIRRIRSCYSRSLARRGSGQVPAGGSSTSRSAENGLPSRPLPKEAGTLTRRR